MSSDWWWVIGATLTTIVFVVPPTIYAWYVLEVWIGAGEVSYAKVMREMESVGDE
jgi:uncharacterized membrane protein YbhN (UPF0104 family)